MTTETPYSPLIRYSASALVEFAENTAYRAREVQVASTNPFLAYLEGRSDINYGDVLGGWQVVKQPADEDQDLFLAWLGSQHEGFQCYITTRLVLDNLTVGDTPEEIGLLWFSLARALFNDSEFPREPEEAEAPAPALLTRKTFGVSEDALAAFMEHANNLILSQHRITAAREFFH